MGPERLAPLLRRMYSWLVAGVNAGARATRMLVVSCGLIPLPPLSCSSELTALFTPRQPLIGRYEVCTTDEPLATVASPDWTVESLEPLDAFGAAGVFNRRAVIRLYRGTRPRVARGWTTRGDGVESVTLVSPYPNARLDRLEPGTMIIRYFVER